MNDGETYSEEGLICPHCGYLNNPADSDGGLYDESLETWNCGNCENDIEVTVYCCYTWIGK